MSKASNFIQMCNHFVVNLLLLEECFHNVLQQGKWLKHSLLHVQHLFNTDGIVILLIFEFKTKEIPMEVRTNIVHIS